MFCLTLLCFSAITVTYLAKKSQTAGASVTSFSSGAEVVYETGPNGEPILPLYYDAPHDVVWGTKAPLSNKLFKSIDGGASWTLVYEFPLRVQTPSTNYWQDKVFAVQVLPSGTILVSADNNEWNYNGTIYRSIDGGQTFSRAKRMDGGDFEFVRGCAFPWAFDHNGSYAVAGTYSYKDPDGATDRDVWASTDDGLRWDRIFHIEGTGNGDINAKNTHIHMARIDPDGGCWISVGDHNSGWSHDNQTLGLWYAPADKLTGPGNEVPRFVGDGSSDFGDFTRIYSHNSEHDRLGIPLLWPRIRPVTAIFKQAGSAKYIYLGEDDMTFNEARTITKMRYDPSAGSDRFVPHILANYTAQFTAAPPTYNGGIFGMCQITDNYWVAGAAELPNISPPSTWALLYSTDGGETWQRDDENHTPEMYLLPVAVHGRVLGGRPPGDNFGSSYRPPVHADFSADKRDGDEPLTVTFSDKSAAPVQINSWHWDFGDGSTSDVQSPVHQFTHGGNFTVTLTVQDVDGYGATETKTDFVSVNNLVPVIDAFSVSASEGSSALADVSFHDAGIGETHSVDIDWGDQSSQETLPVLENGGAGTATGSHAYAESGKYIVTVAVNDDAGGATSESVQVVIGCGSRPAINLGVGRTYWADLIDYQNRVLSVDFILADPDFRTADDVRVIGFMGTNGVSLMTNLPLVIGTIHPAGSATFTLRNNVPEGVGSFRTILYGTACDACGNMYEYPGPFPGA